MGIETELTDDELLPMIKDGTIDKMLLNIDFDKDDEIVINYKERKL